MPSDSSLHQIAGVVARCNTYPTAIVAFLVSRAYLLGVLFGVAPYFGSHRVDNALRLYARWAEVITSTGSYPVNDPLWQYPPLAGWLFVFAQWLTAPSTAGFVALTVIADAAIFGLLLLSRRRSRPASAAWTYLLFGLLVGPMLFARFDIFTTLTAVAALLLIAKPVSSSIAIAIGFCLKLWPLLLVLAFPRRQLPKVVALVVAFSLAITIPVVLFASNATSFLAEQGGRGIQIESVAGSYFIVAHRFGAPFASKYQHGSAEILAPGTPIAAIVVTVIGLILLAVIAYKRLRGRLETVPPADVALVLVLVSIATSRVFSPQFMIWVAGVGAVCLLDKRTRMRPVLLLAGLTTLFGQLVVAIGYPSLMAGNLFGSGLQLVRIVFLLAATAWGLIVILRKDAA